MARLPIPGSDDGTWGDVLNDYLSAAHNTDGTLKDNIVTSDTLAPNAIEAVALQDASVEESKLAISNSPTNGTVLGWNGAAMAWVAPVSGDATDLTATATTTDVTVASSTGQDATIVAATSTNAGVMASSDKTKLDSIEAGAEVNTVTSVAGRTGAVTLAKADVGLTQVDDTSDANKPISSATQAALGGKADTAHTHAASDIASGTVATTRLGAGTADTTTFLRGDQSWQTLPIAWVNVVDPNTDTRPNSGHVMWVGGATQPVNMAAGDIWVRQ